MVKTAKYAFAFVLVLAFAIPAFAQDDYPKFQIAPGYGSISYGNLAPGKHSGFALDTDYNLNSKFGIELFTGYYNVQSGVTFYTNTFGGTATLRKIQKVIPYGTAGIGFGSLIFQNLGSQRAMATRLGLGVDVPFKDLLAFRVEAGKTGVHFGKTWNSGVNYSVGVVLTLSSSN